MTLPTIPAPVVAAGISGAIALFVAFRQHAQGKTINTIEVNTNNRLTEALGALKAANTKIDTLLEAIAAGQTGGKHEAEKAP